MKRATFLTFAAALTIIGSLSGKANAAIIVVAPTTSTAGSIHITNDITFTITTAVNSRLVFVLDEWLTSDGSQNGRPFSPSLSLSINNAIPLNYSSVIVDNLNTTSGVITANDGYFLTLGSISLLSGETMTLKSGFYDIDAGLSFNPQATQTFTGNMFATDNFGNQISNSAAVPEPATSAFLISGAALTLSRRRYRKE